MKRLLLCSLSIALLAVSTAWSITPQPPTTPAVSIKGTDVVITWGAPAANTDGTKPAKVAGYNVYRSTTASITTQRAGGPAPLAGGPGHGIIVPTQTYTDVGAAGKSYFYGVSAWYCDSVTGCAESALSSVVSTSAPAPAPTPPASTSPPATVPVTSTVTLSWTAPTTNADGSALTDLKSYTVYQGPTPASMVKVGTVMAPATSYITPSLQPGTYYFTVSATNAAGIEGGKSAVVSTTIAPPPVKSTPDKPGNVKITVSVTVEP